MFEGLTTGGILGLFLAVSVVLVRANRTESTSAEQYRKQLGDQGETIAEQGRLIQRQGEEINQLKLRDLRCEFRLSVAIGAMRNAGINIPPEALDDGRTTS